VTINFIIFIINQGKSSEVETGGDGRGMGPDPYKKIIFKTPPLIIYMILTKII
jgi:hypothetical protein